MDRLTPYQRSVASEYARAVMSGRHDVARRALELSEVTEKMPRDAETAPAEAWTRDVAPPTGADGEDEAASLPEVPTIDGAAYYGPLGEAVQTIAPHTEASPAAVLVSMLVALGALIGRSPHAMIERQRHGVNLFALLIGHTSDGRKGTAVGYARDLLRQLDTEFLAQRVKTGLSSGQGLIHHVRDGEEPSDRDSKGKPEDRDPGVSDKRLLVIESEFASPLRLKQGKENILSGVLRDAWDGVTLATLTKRESETATDAHVALIAQITPAELRASLASEDYRNGFLNRFIFAYAERTRFLPHGGEIDEEVYAGIIRRLGRCVTTARGCSDIRFGAETRELWAAEYVQLSTGQPGRLGGVTTRGAPLVRRLAMLYALLDARDEIAPAHLVAALAVWQFSVASARYVLADDMTSRGQRTLAAIYAAGKTGLGRSGIREALGSNNIPGSEFATILREVADSGQVRVTIERTAGRPKEVWRHIRHALPLRTNPPGKMVEMGEKADLAQHSSHTSHMSHTARRELPNGERYEASSGPNGERTVTYVPSSAAEQQFLAELASKGLT